jgi:hypothetical protein
MTKLHDPIDDQELDRRLRTTFHTVMPMLDTHQQQGLDEIASSTPTGTRSEFDPRVLRSVTAETPPNRRLIPLLTAAAAAAVAVAGLVAIASRNDGQPASQAERPPIGAPSSDPASGLPVDTPSTIPSAVRGVPICGAELPVAVEVPSATSGPHPGPAVSGPTSEGQFAQYWELPGGTIEFRWPADPREIYDLDGIRGDPSTFEAMSVGVPTDGTQADVDVPTIDPDLNVGSDPLADPFTLRMSATPATAQLGAPCDLLQVRYIDTQGNQTTRGYNLADFNHDPMFGADLNPLITSTHSSVAPDPDTVVDCASAGIDTDVAGPPGSTAADALLAFLDTDQLPGLMASGYTEFTMSEAETVYAIIIDDRLITHITVANTPEGWTVTKVRAPGC